MTTWPPDNAAPGDKHCPRGTTWYGRRAATLPEDKIGKYRIGSSILGIWWGQSYGSNMILFEAASHKEAWEKGIELLATWGGGGARNPTYSDPQKAIIIALEERVEFPAVKLLSGPQYAANPTAELRPSYCVFVRVATGLSTDKWPEEAGA